MNNGIGLSSSIRTNCSEVLSRTVSLDEMHNSLIVLFVDRTNVDTSLARLMDDESLNKSMQYSRCKSLNDERTIKFNQSCKQESDVFDETRQIWIDEFIDPINDDMFIPRDDAQ